MTYLEQAIQAAQIRFWVAVAWKAAVGLAIIVACLTYIVRGGA